jgi:WD40 repeat protein
MALAAVADLLARRGLKVLAVDFDLEAPGLERYFFDNEGSRKKRTEAGLIDLIQTYRRALTDEAEFERADFKQLHRFTAEAIVEASSRGGSVHLMTAGRREPAERLREYALAVRSFDWQDFFYNWKGDRFFDWLRHQWSDPRTGYDVVLVDSRTGVTEMGGVCAYQLADVAVLLCAPNYQNLEGTRDVAHDFISDGVLGLRQGRPLDILAIPARLEANHPKREDFIRAFELEMGSEGLPLALAEIGLTYRDLALPYFPEFSIEERLVGEDGGSEKRSQAMNDVFARLTDALILLVDPHTRMGQLRYEALARLKGGSTDAITELEADTSRTSSGYDAFIDYGKADRETAMELAHRLDMHTLRVFLDSESFQPRTSWSAQLDLALEYSASVLVCFGHSSSTPLRASLLEKARRSTRRKIIPVLLPGGDETALRSFGLETDQYLDLRAGLDARAIEELATFLKRPVAARRSVIESQSTREPYPGKRPYSEDDSRFFHGRQEEIYNLLQALTEFDLVLLEGPAMVGKTSVINAGLLPQLRQGWKVEGLPGLGRIALLDVAVDTFQPPAWIQDHPSNLNLAEEKSMDMCIIDSIDSYCTNASVQKHRFEWMEDLVGRVGPHLRLLLVWRGTLPDEQYHAVLASWRRHSFKRIILAPLQGKALQAAIEQPARDAGHLLENGLTDRLIESAGDSKNAIFQIQLALAALWRERRRGWLTNKGLDGLGHLAAVFQRHIDTTLADLSESDRKASNTLFQKLSQLAPNLKLVSQPQPWAVIETVPAINTVGATRLRECLAAAGLIDLWREVAEGQSLPPLATKSATFVALTRPNPMQYLGGGETIPDPEFFMWRKQLDTYARQWDSTGQSPETLLKGSTLSQAEHWLTSRDADLTALEKDFIVVSVQARHITERDIEKKRRRRMRTLVFAIVVMFVLLIFSAYQYRSARQSQADLNWRRLLPESEAMLNGTRLGGDERAFLQVLAAWRSTPSNDAAMALVNVLIERASLTKIWQTGGQVQGVAFHPNGKQLVSGSDDHTIRLWDAKTGQPIGRPWKGHSDRVTSVVFSPDGTRVVSASDDRTLRLWDARSGESIGDPWKGHEDTVISAVFSPDGTRVVSASVDHSVRLWDARSGRPIGNPWKRHTDGVMSVAFSPDGTRVVSGSADHTIRLWDSRSGQPIGGPWKGHTDSVLSVMFSPDGTRVVTGSADHTIRLWDSRSGQGISGPWKGHTRPVWSVAFDPSGTRVVSGSADQTVRLWEASGQPLGTPWKGHNRVIWSVAFSPDGTQVVSASADQTVRLWNAESRQQFGAPLKGHTDTVQSVAFSPDGKRVVSGSDDRTVRLWDAQSGQPIGTFTGHERSVWSVAFSPDGTRVVSGSDDRTLRLWDAQSGQPVGTPWVGHTQGVQSVAFSPDGTQVVSGGDDHRLILWDVQSSQSLGPPWEMQSRSILSVAFSPDGTRVVSGGADQTLRLWNTRSGKPIGGAWMGHTGTVASVAFSPDGTRVVSGSADQTLRLWDAQSGKPIGGPWLGHAAAVWSVAFSPDGTRVVSGSDDRTLRLWDAHSGQSLAQWIGHTAPVHSIAFSSYGTHIVSASADNTLRLWSDQKLWPALLCAKLTRNMSYKEWREWVGTDLSYLTQCEDLPIPSEE